jgi:hypothetical protein
MFNGLPLTTTRVTLRLHLLEDAWSKHMFPYGDAMATAGRACLDDTICASAAFTFITDLLFFKLEFGLMAIVKISQGDGNANLHIRAAPLAMLMSKVPSAPKEAAEQVKRIMTLLATLALLLS